MLAALPLLTAPASAAEPVREVRACYYPYGRLHELSPDGKYSGFGYEVLELLAKKAGWTNRYLGHDRSWAESERMIETGELDVIDCVRKLPGREKRYEFSALPMGFPLELPFRVREVELMGARTSSSVQNMEGNSSIGTDGDVRSPGFSGRRILLVEDNELNREVATYVLKEQGFEVDIACDGSEAVEKVCGIKVEEIGRGGRRNLSTRASGLRKTPTTLDLDLKPRPSPDLDLKPQPSPSPYDFILMDIQMPVMGGYEATRAIRYTGAVFAGEEAVYQTDDPLTGQGRARPG